ncbi:MAG: helix-turn-helix domain-containing protein [Chitinophagaceae bacterium]
MAANILLIKNMVCRRCMMAVEDILRKANLPFEQILIGEVHMADAIGDEQRERLKKDLEQIGFELIDNRMSGMMESIKQHVIKKARNQVTEREVRMKLSDYLSSKLHHEYTYLSGLFSSIEGRTIENYFIEQRIENAKELLTYGEMTLSQIALELEYSSTAHLSSQFKKITGHTPSHFRQIGAEKRKALDQV